MTAVDTCSSIAEVTSAMPHRIISGPDKWNFLLGLAEPGGFDSNRRRPEFNVEFDEDNTYVCPILIVELKRLDSTGAEWAFSGRVDRPADFDNYDSDGDHRAVCGLYNTDSRSGSIAFS
jgi:hypothetical protein